MRRTFRLLANASATGARYLEPGAPTGLTGLATHVSPRSTLLYLYATTLNRLQAVPAHSLYRQSVEALTRHRMSLVEAAVPPGYEAWANKFARRVAENPSQFNIAGRADGTRIWHTEHEGRLFVLHRMPEHTDARQLEWDGEVVDAPEPEGSRTLEEKAYQGETKNKKQTDLGEDEMQEVEWESEPRLTADQVEELEVKIGAGLIEEVIQVAEGELNLVDRMVKAKVWEDLEEEPVEGQWTYFERKA